ncbi:MAG TPA: chemotaxis protein [Alphaproteobacteria bacterium]|nr:chemotaxis protein [Alphaproteobacteria bacterium]
MKKDLFLTGKQRDMKDGDIIVSKTNLKGHVVYGNDVFCDIAGYTVSEIMGTPHSFLRHPDMPRCVFKLLWDSIQAGKEIFAYVVNRAKNGDHYWVMAHVTPSFDPTGNIIGYHSNRRKPSNSAINAISSLYKTLKQVESNSANPKDGMQAGYEHLIKILNEKNISYDEFILSI